ncbi:hypothetical protein [Pontiella sulfatireligans]|nr:hypothetical protein [Pontiella sulfatireligans]
MAIIDKYTDALKSIPAPGGDGCHASLLGASTLGIMAGLTEQQILADVRVSIPSGKRRVSDREIIDAIKRARMDTQPLGEKSDHKPVSPRPRPPEPLIKPSYSDHLIQKGTGFTELDFINASPVPLIYEPQHDARLILETLYRPDDILFIGERYDTVVHPVSEWLRIIDKQGTAGLPHIVPNPVTGGKHPAQSRKPSFRCDAAIKSFRFCIIEFDNLSRAEQLAFWAAVPLPVAALIDSGNKSVHGWIAVEGVSTNQEWEEQIKIELYARRFIPMGVDPSCRNESRLSRLPGHLRAGTQRYQRLLYLNPSPKPKPIL